MPSIGWSMLRRSRSNTLLPSWSALLNEDLKSAFCVSTIRELGAVAVHLEKVDLVHWALEKR